MRGERLNRNRRGNHFTQEGGGIQNKLPEEVADAGAITTFKIHLEEYIERK